MFFEVTSEKDLKSPREREEPTDTWLSLIIELAPNSR